MGILRSRGARTGPCVTTLLIRAASVEAAAESDKICPVDLTARFSRSSFGQTHPGFPVRKDLLMLRSPKHCSGTALAEFPILVPFLLHLDSNGNRNRSWHTDRTARTRVLHLVE